jgi:O-antigen ligase
MVFGGSSRTGTHLTFLIVLFLAWVPVPLGSNRPIFWSMNAMLIGAIGLYFFARKGWTQSLAQLDLRPLPAMFLIVIAFLVLQLLPLPSGALSVAPGATVLMLLRMITYGLVFLLVLHAAQNGERFSFMMDAALAIGTLHAGAALFMLRSGDTILGFPKTAYLGSATGTFVNRNSFATFCAVLCCLAVAQIARAIVAVARRREAYRSDLTWLRLALSFAAFFVLAAALVASQSRMGVVAAGVGIVVTAVIICLTRLRARTALLLAAGLAAGAALVTLYSGPLVSRFLEVEQSWGIRFALYRQVVDMISTRLWTGFGGGSFEVVYPTFHQLPVAPDRVWDKAHNSYLTLAAELGLPMAVLVTVMFVVMATMIARGLLRNRRQWFAASIGLGCLTVVGVHALVDFSMEIQAVTVWLLALVAATIAQCRFGRGPGGEHFDEDEHPDNAQAGWDPVYR